MRPSVVTELRICDAKCPVGGRAWGAANERVPFPARPADLVDHLLAHSRPVELDESRAVAMDRDATGQRTRRASTVQRWLASLSTAQGIAEHADPTRELGVEAARRARSRRRVAPEQKAPLRWADVEEALATRGNERADLRAKAMIVVAYSTLARRAEPIDVRVEDITFGTEGDGTVTLRNKGGH
jgi:integrase